MTQSNPTTLTLIGLAYNSQTFLLPFLNSIFAQTEANFKLVIVDDGSTDKTADTIKEFSDPRITLAQNPFNMGVNASIEHALGLIDTPLVGIIALDDMLAPTYVETLLKTYTKHTDISVCYVNRMNIDETGTPLEDTFKQPQEMDTSAILYQLFFLNNILSSPGMCVRTSDLQRLLPLNASILNYSDLQWHIELLFSSSIHFIKEPLVFYRTHKTNISKRSPSIIARETAEVASILDTFAKHIDLDSYKKIFSSHPAYRQYPPSKTHLNYCLGQIALTSPNKAQRIWGYQHIAKELRTREQLVAIHNAYSQDFKDFRMLSNYLVPPKSKTEKRLEYKLKRYKAISIAVSLLCITCIAILSALLLWS